MIRRLAWLLLICGILSALGELLGLQLPTLNWPFSVSAGMSVLGCRMAEESSSNPFLREGVFLWFGWGCCLIFVLLGTWLLCQPASRFTPTPITKRRWERFRSISRGYFSLWIVVILAGICCFDQVLVGKKALVVHYNGQWYFPALVQKQYTGDTFGLTGDTAQSETNYRQLASSFQKTSSGNFVLMPLVPYDPTGDSQKPSLEKLEQKENGLLYRDGDKTAYSGLATRFYDTDSHAAHLRFRFRRGTQDGPSAGWDKEGSEIYSGLWRKGKMQSESWSGNGSMEEFLKSSPGDYYIIHYHPAPPLQGGHLLGTTSQGADILAYLFGGLQVNIKAALFFLPCVYFIGITIGMMMGYYGGWFDLVIQRMIEIFSQIPYLLVIIIISSMMPLAWRGLPLILGILILFSWMEMTYQLRTSTIKEKSRDYVAAARVLGASTPRILFLHILPNLIAILVTLVPFSVSALILALASLDYLGFGLPDNYASWGRLLNDGLNNLSCPWVVSAAFVALVSTLLLVTFIGEAIREAFDPKKFTTYK